MNKNLRKADRIAIKVILGLCAFTLFYILAQIVRANFRMK